MQIRGNDIASKIIANDAAATKTNQQIEVALVKKQLDAQKQSGQAAVDLIQQAAKVGHGRGVDLRA